MSSGADTKPTKKAKKNQQNNDNDEVAKLTKEETAIAKFLRLKCPNKPGSLVGMKITFFIGSKLIDCLMESQWGPGKDGANKAPAKDSKQPPALFASRQACVSFMQRLMNKQLFHRAVKVYKETETATTDKEVKNAEKSSNTPDLRKRATKEAASDATPKSSATPSETQKESKKKFKLEMHEEQKFYDANEPYVWIYDPTSTMTYLIGLGLILGSIGLCMFPLWPSQVREGVYYISVAGATFLGAILAVAVIKYVIFGLVWACTFGKVTFWLFPNLTEDVGFFESFAPVYKCNRSSASDKAKAKEETLDVVKSSETTTSPMTESTSFEKASASNTPTTGVKKTPTSKVVSNELSKSTLMINSLASDSPLLRSKTNSKDTADDEFELLDNDELVKKETNEESSDD